MKFRAGSDVEREIVETTAYLQSTPQGNDRSREQGEAAGSQRQLVAGHLDEALKGEGASERRDLATF
jgi:hypothetical protein